MTPSDQKRLYEEEKAQRRTSLRLIDYEQDRSHEEEKIRRQPRGWSPINIFCTVGFVLLVVVGLLYPIVAR